MLLSRPDGFLVDQLPPMRRMMPYILRTRNESCVYFEQKLDLSEALPYLSELSAELGEGQGGEINLFHLILAAAARVFRERPDLNRFVSGGNIYQRRHIELSFALKKERSDKGALTTTKLRFSGEESVREVASMTRSAITVGRSLIDWCSRFFGCVLSVTKQTVNAFHSVRLLGLKKRALTPLGPRSNCPMSRKCHSVYVVL